MRKLGEGSFGDVYLGTSKENASEQVAIKVMKRQYRSWKECLGLREVKVRVHIAAHTVHARDL